MEVHTKQLANLSYTKEKTPVYFLILIVQNLTMNCESTSRNLHLPLIVW